jgi:hypothetical protein
VERGSKTIPLAHMPVSASARLSSVEMMIIHFYILNTIVFDDHSVILHVSDSHHHGIQRQCCVNSILQVGIKIIF